MKPPKSDNKQHKHAHAFAHVCTNMFKLVFHYLLGLSCSAQLWQRGKGK